MCILFKVVIDGLPPRQILDALPGRLIVGSPLEAGIGYEKTFVAFCLPFGETCRRTEIGRLVADLFEVKVENDMPGLQVVRGIDKVFLFLGGLVGPVDNKSFFLFFLEGEALQREA